MDIQERLDQVADESKSYITLVCNMGKACYQLPENELLAGAILMLETRLGLIESNLKQLTRFVLKGETGQK